MELKQAFLRAQSFRRERLENDSCDYWVENCLVPLILVLTMISSATQLVGGRFTCAYSLNIPGSYMPYIISTCWTNGTYYFPTDQPFDTAEHTRHKIEPIRYYPLVPLLMVACVVLLLIPGILYRALAKRSGVGMEFILRNLQACEQDYIRASGEEVRKREIGRLQFLANLGKNLNLYRRKCESKSIIDSGRVLKRQALRFWTRDS